MKAVPWDEWVVSDRQFRALRRRIRGQRPRVKIHFLSTRTLDRLYVMIFPDGSLVVPSGPTYAAFGPFLEITDLGAVLSRSRFAAVRHWRHAGGWQPRQSAGAPRPAR